MKTKTYTTTTTIRRFELGRDDILTMLSDLLGNQITDSTEVFIMVPDGGDYSGIDLHVGSEVPLIVRVEEKVEKEK